MSRNEWVSLQHPTALRWQARQYLATPIAAKKVAASACADVSETQVERTARGSTNSNRYKPAAFGEDKPFTLSAAPWRPRGSSVKACVGQSDINTTGGCSMPNCELEASPHPTGHDHGGFDSGDCLSAMLTAVRPGVSVPRWLFCRLQLSMQATADGGCRDIR